MGNRSRHRSEGGLVTASYHPSRLPGLYCSTLVDEGPPRVRVHDRLVLLAITAGEALVWSRGETRALAPGSLLVIEPGEVHRDLRKTSYRAVTLEFHPALVEALHRAAGEEGSDASAPHPASSYDGALALARAVRAGRDRAVQEGLALQLVQRLATAGMRQPPPVPPPLVARARRALADAAGAPLSLNELAARLGCDSAYLCRVFSRYTGVGPHAYQLQQRLLQARCLVESGRTVAAAAALTGFGDESHLRRHFRRRFSVPPGRYQQALAVRHEGTGA